MLVATAAMKTLNIVAAATIAAVAILHAAGAAADATELAVSQAEP